MIATKEELVEHFPSIQNKEGIDEIITEMQSIMNIFTLDIDELELKWEAYSMNMNVPDITPESLRRLKSYVQAELEKENQSKGNLSIHKPRGLIPRSTPRSAVRTTNFSSPDLKFPSTPTIKRNHIEDTPLASKRSRNILSSSPILSSPIISSTPFKSQQLKNSKYSVGERIEGINSHIRESNGVTEGSQSTVKIIANFDGKKYGFRTMRQKILEAADVLDDQIDSFIKLLKEHHNLSYSDFGNPAAVSQSETIVVGRIVPDSANPPIESALSTSSIALESSRQFGLGQRVLLKLDKMDNYSFFPGQIVGLKGRNANGDYFSVHEILDIPYLPAAVSPIRELQSFKESMGNRSLKIVVVNGPYTSSNDFEFAGLKSLVDQLNGFILPDVVIMLGPFIDSTHPLISKGLTSLSTPSSYQDEINNLDDIFRKCVSSELQRLDTKIQVVMIPHIRDTSSKHVAYPQDSLERKYLELPKNVKCFPNPCTFSLNEAMIGVSTNDILYDLKDTNVGEWQKKNRYERTIDHVMEQRRYYPVFPGSENSNLDVPYLGLSELDDVVPDILIMPSEKLRYAVKVVRNAILINPGSLMKNNTMSTFATISIDPPNIDELTKAKDEEASDDLVLHDIWNRARVDIVQA